MATPFKITKQAYLWVPGIQPQPSNVVAISAHNRRILLDV